jgi:hypothetical protein
MEIYKKICGYENYEVSNQGNIKNIKTGKILKPQLSSSGYYNITLSQDGIRETPTVHSLVAMHFIETKNQTVNHKDGNKLNNSIDNLEYVTYSENTKHAHDTKLMKKIHSRNSRNTSGKVGVVWDKHSNRWIARLHKNSRAVYLGSFKNKEEAIKCREEAENDYR